MHLTAHQIALLSRVMATLAEPHSEGDIRKRVGELMMDLLGAQHYASYVWDEQRQCFDAGVRINMDAKNIENYERHYQYHDPITPKLQQHRTAVRVSDVMPQCSLVRTEFFNDFLFRDGLYWGVNLYAWSGDRNIGDMRIWRDRRRENFTRDDLQLLDLIRPAFVAALQRCQQDCPTQPAFPRVLEEARHALLSARELDVARLVCTGLADKEIARRLGVSLTTVRTHIDHSFRKLDVNSRMTLAQKLKL